MSGEHEGAENSGGQAGRSGSPVAPGGGRARSAVRWLIVIACVLAAGAGAAYYWLSHAGAAVATSQPARTIPVVAATAKRGDLPIYLTGLGTVTALNTATVRTRVDGQIMHINFTEGQTVKKDEVLMEIDPRPFEVMLTQAQGQLARDQALLTNAKLDVDRYTEARVAIAQQILDTAVATVKQDEGNVLTDQGQIDSAKLQITYCHIIAPFEGKIGLRMVDEGNVVHAADVNGLAVITQVKPIYLIFSLAEDSLQQVLKTDHEGIGLPVEAYNRDMRTKLAVGKLYAIDNQIDPTTGTARFEGVFDNKDDALFPNQFVNARLLVETRKNVILVPSAAVQESPQGAFVFLVRGKGEEQKVKVQQVKTGPAEGELTSIRQGLNPGDMVVTDGVDKLQDGTKVAAHAAGSKAATAPAGESAATRSSP